MFSANQKAFVICTRVTEELHSFLSQSELSNFFVYIIKSENIMEDFLRPRVKREKIGVFDIGIGLPESRNKNTLLILIPSTTSTK